MSPKNSKIARRSIAVVILLLISLISYLVSVTISSIPESVLDYLEFGYKFTLILALILMIPWNDLDLIIIDAKEFRPNRTERELVHKLRLRALLYKNLSVLILGLTIVIIGFAVYSVVGPGNLDSIPNDNVWNLATIKLSTLFLLIFLIHILFRVFRYIIRLAGYYDGISDAIEIYLTDEKHELESLLEKLVPVNYDIRELKQGSIADYIKGIVKQG